MRNHKVTFLMLCFVFFVFSSTCSADTFTNRQTAEQLHGYITTQIKNGKTVVFTRQKGPVELNLTHWNIKADTLGRNNKVIILTLDTEISLEIETKALTQAIADSSDQGPLFIVLEIDTPGGRTDLAQRICSVITNASHCQVIAFVKGGQYGGAISAGAAVALACDKNFMAPSTIIGAAAAIAISKDGPASLEEIFGKTIGEKFSSAWRAYLASLAEQNGRPGILARAMVDSSIEAIEVSGLSDKRSFIESINKKQSQQLTKTWSKEGSLLTLTAAEAVSCGIADKLIDSRQRLLQILNAENAEIVINTSVRKAAKEFRRAKLKFDKIQKSLDLKIKQMQQTKSRPIALRRLREIKTDFKSLVTLAKRYPDLHLNQEALEAELNSVEAVYQEAKRKKRR